MNNNLGWQCADGSSYIADKARGSGDKKRNCSLTNKNETIFSLPNGEKSHLRLSFLNWNHSTLHGQCL